MQLDKEPMSPAAVTEIRTYTLKMGTGAAFHRLVVEQSLPMLQRWGVDVVAFGPSLDDEDLYYLIRRHPSLEERRRSQDAFYGSDEWRDGPREEVRIPDREHHLGRAAGRLRTVLAELDAREPAVML